MPVYYCKMPNGNVGDDLNEEVWKRYINIEQLPSNHLVVGIGSLFNENIPNASKYTVITPGVGYGKLPKINSSWEFIALRGEISKQKIGLTEDLVLLDGAYLLTDFYEKPNVTIEHDVGYIPHVESFDKGNWHEICEQADLKLIDPRLKLDEFIRELCSCKKVICEAMHGAILADMFQIPWKPVNAYHDINTEKWDDWLSAFRKRAKFTTIKGVWRNIPMNRSTYIKNLIKRIIFIIVQPESITPPIYPESSQADIHKTIHQLKGLKEQSFYLNDQKVIKEKVDKLTSAIKSFNNSLS